MTSLRRIALATGLALGLAACGGGGEDGATSSEPVDEVAAPAGQQWADVVEVTPEGGWKIGNPNAPIRLVEYGSLTCPACANFAEDGMEPLREQYVNSGRVNFEFRSVPLHGAIDLALTRLIQCAPKEAAIPLADQVWANLDAILQTAQANAASLEQALSLPDDQRFVAFAERAQLYDFFAARGISTDQARACLSDFPAIQSLAETLQSQSEKDDITGTPTFILNGRNIGSLRWAEVEANLQNAGAR